MIIDDSRIESKSVRVRRRLSNNIFMKRQYLNRITQPLDYFTMNFQQKRGHILKN